MSAPRRNRQAEKARVLERAWQRHARGVCCVCGEMREADNDTWRCRRLLCRARLNERRRRYRQRKTEAA
jgi:hypothetical protein